MTAKTPLIIGIGHAKRHGKDSLCRFMLEHFIDHCYIAHRVSFADKLKDVCHQLYHRHGLMWGPYYEQREYAAEREIPLPTIGKSPRQIWIEVGNKLREVHAETWIDLAIHDESNAVYDFIIIPDVRYPNEVDAIRKAGGYLVKVTRPGLKESNDVADDALREWDGWDVKVFNDGGLSELRRKAGQLCATLIDKQMA